jgi:hypothetical protein
MSHAHIRTTARYLHTKNTFTEERSPDQRRQAVSDLAEVKCFAVLLATIR